MGRKPNVKLAEKRRAESVKVERFPLTIRIKPTASKQFCFLCRNQIAKGEKQILLESGMWHAWLERDVAGRKMRHEKPQFHTVRMGKPMELARSGPDHTSLYLLRHIYLHDTCFGCLLKMMSNKISVDFKIDPGCDKCDRRFNCFTGNFDLRDISMRAPYVPTKQTGLEDE